MQHVGLSVINLFEKFHKILTKNKKVIEPNMSKTNCLLETGSGGTGSRADINLKLSVCAYFTIIFNVNLTKKFYR